MLGRGDEPGRVLRQQVAQPAQLVRVVPVHPHAEPDRLLGLAGGVGEDALLAQAHELGDAVGLDVALAGETEILLDVDFDPESLAVEAVLIALVAAVHGPEALEEVLVGAAPGVMHAHRVVCRDRPVEEAPALVARVLGSQAGKSAALTPQRQDLVLLGDEIGLGADGFEHDPQGKGGADGSNLAAAGLFGRRSVIGLGQGYPS